MSAVQEALALARNGFPVFPLRPRTKQPATKHGFKDASRNPTVIRDWWERHPDAGIGVATGHGVVVIDVDTVEGHGADGPQSLIALEQENGSLPDTAEVRTAGGGRHLWFTGPRIRSRTGMAPGLDLKADGGYVVAPPTSLNGSSYQWISKPSADGLAALPHWVPALGGESRGAQRIPETIHDGEGRETFLVSLAGTLRRRGLGEEEILGTLREVNVRRCRPPKPETDLRRIAGSIAGYAPSDEAVNGERSDPALLEALRSASSEEDVFSMLRNAAPPRDPLGRQQARARLLPLLQERFGALGSAASAARVADGWLRGGGSESAEVPGREFSFEPTVPWESAIDGESLLGEVADTLERYIHASRSDIVAMTLWIIHTHVYDTWGVSPILLLSSATKRCGKTAALTIIQGLAHKGLPASSITPASLFRLVDRDHPTLCIDEADTFLKMAEEFRGILNAGHTRQMAWVIRAEGEQHEPRRFSTWAPKVIAAIGNLPDTIEDRSVRVVLRRKPPSIQKADPFDPDAVHETCLPLRRRIARWARDNAEVLTDLPERPPGLNDRAWNNWKPLLAIADAAGGSWPEEARGAAISLSDAGDADDAGTLALRHLKAAFGDSERRSTDELLEALAARDDGPWGRWWGRALSTGDKNGPASRLSKILKPFGIQPKQMKIDHKKVRGYTRADFSEVWEVYAPEHWRAYAPPEEDAPDETAEAPMTSGDPLSELLG